MHKPKTTPEPNHQVFVSDSNQTYLPTYITLHYVTIQYITLHYIIYAHIYLQLYAIINKLVDNGVWMKVCIYKYL
jgi:hypothetical protein